MKNLMVIALLLSVSLVVEAKKKTFRKVQEVNFSEMSLKGALRNPDGSYLVQKKGIKFLPLYDVQKNFDERIRASSNLVD